MESQCLGLAEALELAPAIHRIVPPNPWRDLAPYLRIGLRRAFAGTALAPPWPDLLIATGRLSVPASMYLRQESPQTRRVQIQDSGISPRHFDLVVAPMHDDLWGVNVIQTIGALHRATPERLGAEAAQLAPRATAWPRPLIGVLVGGANSVYRFGVEEARRFATELAEQAARTGGSLLVTPSRRTGEANIAILREALAGVPGFVWDGSGHNPYFGMIGFCDVLVATSDSVNMITEACASGKPVYIYRVPGGSNKFEQFHEALTLRGYARMYDGSLESFPVNRLYEMTRVARAVRQIP